MYYPQTGLRLQHGTMLEPVCVGNKDSARSWSDLPY